MRNTSWCVPSPTMARTCLNQSSPREWAHTKAFSTTSNGTNCEWFFPLFCPPPFLCYFQNFLNYSRHSVHTLPPCCSRCSRLSQDQLPHSSGCSPTGVHTESDSVWGLEPKCQRLPRLQQTEESSRDAGQSFYAAFWLQRVRREKQLLVAELVRVKVHLVMESLKYTSVMKYVFEAITAQQCVSSVRRN